MLKKLTPDLRFILSVMALNRPPAVLQTPGAPVDFVAVTDRRYKLRHVKPNPVEGRPDACPVEPGTHTNPERNFMWLPWVEGRISYIPLTNNIPIVTGLMSGCWLVVFRMNGQDCFGHIGTELSPQHPNSLRAKNAWKVAVGSRKITPVKAFNPVEYGPGTMKTFGALSVHHTFYTIGCSVDGNTFQVVAKTRVPAPPLAPPQFF